MEYSLRNKGADCSASRRGFQLKRSAHGRLPSHVSRAADLLVRFTNLMGALCRGLNFRFIRAGRHLAIRMVTADRPSVGALDLLVGGGLAHAEQCVSIPQRTSQPRLRDRP